VSLLKNEEGYCWNEFSYDSASNSFDLLIAIEISDNKNLKPIPPAGPSPLAGHVSNQLEPLFCVRVCGGVNSNTGSETSSIDYSTCCVLLSVGGTGVYGLLYVCCMSICRQFMAERILIYIIMRMCNTVVYNYNEWGITLGGVLDDARDLITDNDQYRRTTIETIDSSNCCDCGVRGICCGEECDRVEDVLISKVVKERWQRPVVINCESISVYFETISCNDS